MHESGEYDAFLHVGLADRAPYVLLEKRARRIGCAAPYPAGLLPELVDEEKGDKGHGFSKCEEDKEEDYKTTVDLIGGSRGG